jgi:prepilin-type N-terminal cleavage/methylation domain-containing protein
MKKQSGFTLLELLVVITLVAVIAGVAVAGYDNYQVQSRYETTRFEMTQIRRALIQFRRDSGTNDFPTQGIYDCTDEVNGGADTDANTQMVFPVAGTDAELIEWCEHPANFWMLMQDPFGMGWNPDTRRGWNGPYLQRGDEFASVDADIFNDGTEQANTDGEIDDAYVVNDPYGSPYYLFDLDNADINNPARLESLGNNQFYDGADNSDCTETELDGYPIDYVMCLLE